MGVKLTETERRLLEELRLMEKERVHRSQANMLARMGWHGLRGISKLHACLNRLEKLGAITSTTKLAFVAGPGLSREGRRMLERAA